MANKRESAEWLAEYAIYHKKVVAACLETFSGRSKNADGSDMTDDEIRDFFGKVCSYEEEFDEGISPEETAERQWEACT